jgi:hypothetical protein
LSRAGVSESSFVLAALAEEPCSVRLSGVQAVRNIRQRKFITTKNFIKLPLLEIFVPLIIPYIDYLPVFVRIIFAF